MLRLCLVALAVAMMVACASGGSPQVDPCERAIKRIVDECGFQVDTQGMELHCSGQSACVAVCLEQSPCEDIANNDGEFEDCLADCQ